MRHKRATIQHNDTTLRHQRTAGMRHKRTVLDHNRRP